MRAAFTALAAVTLLAGCGPREFREARKLERSKEPLSAIAMYGDFARKHPKHPKAPEALYRAGEIYRDQLRNYPMARSSFLRVAKEWPGTDWEKKSQAALVDCPDYFPLVPGLHRVLGDSDSGGQHMRIDERCETDPKSAGRFRVLRKIYAGQQEVATEERLEEKNGGEVREYAVNGSSPCVLLRMPAEPGSIWDSTKDGRKLRLSVLSNRENVRVQAGTFADCLAVRVDTEGNTAGWKVEFYAPGVGLVLTSAGSQRGETRIAELLSYEIPR